MLEGAKNLLLEQYLKFEFKACNNQYDYEAFITSMNLAIEMGVLSLRARSDSHLILNLVVGEYQIKKNKLIRYITKLR